MTDEERIAYACAQRENCRPMECSLDRACWVTVGGKDALKPISLSGTPRCGACDGKILLEQWRTPATMGLPSHGRLLTRGRARPQGAVDRGQAPRPGEGLRVEGGDSVPLRAEEAS